VTVDGQGMSTSVDGNGNATVSLTLPLVTAIVPQSITASFSGPNHLPSSTTQTALLGLQDGLLQAVDTFAADGSQAVQTFFLGVPLWDFLYTAGGQPMAAVFGFDLFSLNLSFAGGLSLLSLDGVLPVAIGVSTPQGQLLGVVTLTT